MKKDDCRYTITINTSENRALPFGKLYDTHQQQSEEEQNTYCSHKALFLPDRTENKIGILLGYITKFGLRSIEKTFPGKTTRTDRYFRLVDIIAHPHRIFGDSQSHLDTGTLVRFKYTGKRIIDRFQEKARQQGKYNSYPQPTFESLEV